MSRPKLHASLPVNAGTYLPRFAVITDGKTHELKVARKLRWEPGTIVVFDRGPSQSQISDTHFIGETDLPG